MDFSMITEIFQQYGITGVLLLTIGFLTYYIIKHSISEMNNNMNKGIDKIAQQLSTSISDQNKKMFEQLSSQNDKIITYILNSNSLSTDTLHNQKLNERMEITETINGKLKDILQYSGAQRVIILEFHNSNQNLVGIPFAKFSATYEWFRRGVRPIQNVCKSMTFSTISSVVKDLTDNQKQQIVYDDLVGLMQQNPALSDILDQAKAKSVIFNAMYNDKNYILGLVAIEFSGDIPNHVNLNTITEDVIEITSLINLNYKYDKK